MAILKAKPDAIYDSDHTLNRVFPVTAKLTKEERGKVTGFARSQGLARDGMDMRCDPPGARRAGRPLIAGRDSRDRWLLVNVLRPRPFPSLNSRKSQTFASLQPRTIRSRPKIPRFSHTRCEMVHFNGYGHRSSGERTSNREDT